MQRTSFGLAIASLVTSLLLGLGAAAAAAQPAPSAAPPPQVAALGPIGPIGLVAPPAAPMPESSARAIRAADARAEAATVPSEAPGRAASGAVFWALGAMLVWIAARRG